MSDANLHRNQSERQVSHEALDKPEGVELYAFLDAFCSNDGPLETSGEVLVGVQKGDALMQASFSPPARSDPGGAGNFEREMLIGGS